MLSVPWLTRACFLIGPLGFDARLWTREQRNSWEKAMQTLILPELEVRGQQPSWEPAGRYPWWCPPGAQASVPHTSGVGGTG